MNSKLQISRFEKYIFLVSLFFVLFSFGAYSQGKYTIQFKSGNIDLAENINEYNIKRTANIFNGYNYILLQFNELPSASEKEKLNSLGIKLIDYIPNLSYTAKVSTSIDEDELIKNNIRAFHQMDLNQKMEANIFYDIYPEWSKESENEVKVQVVLIDDFTIEVLQPELEKLNAKLLLDELIFRTLTIQLPTKNVKKLAAEHWVMWVEPSLEPYKIEGIDDKQTHRSGIISNGLRTYTGKGVKLGVWDAGKVGKHIDFFDRLTQVQGSSDHYHANHCAGISTGKGLRDPEGIGNASEALLYSYDYGGSVPSELQYAHTNFGVLISTNSYGGSVTCSGDPYTSNSRSQDLVVNTNLILHFLFSSGNSQTSCTGGFKTTTGKAAKNTITVGAVSDKDGTTSFSSYGPTKDGRVKPEVVSVGSNVYSTDLDHTYAVRTGTSMACPGVAGVCAQLIQAYQDNNSGNNPRTSLLKALLCNTARDLGNPGPDYKFGYGRINALKAAKAIEQNRFKVDNITTGAANDITFNVPAGTKELKVLLSWNDPAGAANANPALVNDLNLEVIDPSNVTWDPWVLSFASPSAVATRKVDNVNVIEQVTISNPAAGTYTFRVKGNAVASGANQEYAITWEADPEYVEVTFPAGFEKLKPGTAATVHWDKEGITANQKFEYSLNSGTTWTTVSSSISPNSSYFTWAVPNVFSNTVRVKITSGGVSDESDADFTIMGVPSSVTASDDACGVKVTWTSVANATGYDVMLLDTTKGEWNVAGSNVSGNSYVVGGLNLNTRYWFTVRARVQSQLIVGERAVATYRINTGTGGTTPTIIANGPLLSTQSATTYQWLWNGNPIAGATNQNYTATTGGYYSVIVTNSSGCNASSTPVLVTFVGLDENKDDATFVIYPNPNQGVFELDFNGLNSEQKKIIITNVLGEEVYKYEFVASSFHKRIDLSEFGKGAFIVTLLGEKSAKSKKIIIN